MILLPIEATDMTTGEKLQAFLEHNSDGLTESVYDLFFLLFAAGMFTSLWVVFA